MADEHYARAMRIHQGNHGSGCDACCLRGQVARLARDYAEACEKRDLYQMAYEEEAELHGELRTLFSAEAGDTDG